MVAFGSLRVCLFYVRVSRVINDSFNLHRFIIAISIPLSLSLPLFALLLFDSLFISAACALGNSSCSREGENKKTNTEPHHPHPMKKRIQRTAPKISHFLFVFLVSPPFFVCFLFAFLLCFLPFFRLHSFPCHFVNFNAAAAQFSVSFLRFFYFLFWGAPSLNATAERSLEQTWHIITRRC